MRRSGSLNKCSRLIKVDGSVVVKDFLMYKIGTIRFFMRFELLHLFNKFVLGHTDTNLIYGAQVSHAWFLPTVEMDVTMGYSHPNGNGDGKCNNSMHFKESRENWVTKLRAQVLKKEGKVRQR